MKNSRHVETVVVCAALVLVFAAGTARAQGPVNASITIPNAGVFTNAAMNEYATSLLNNCNLTTQFQLEQGGLNYATEGIAACASVPSTAPVHQINALAGYVTSACNSGGSAHCNAVGIYTQAIADADHASVWGGNFVVTDTPAGSRGNTGLAGLEIDIGASGTPTSVQGINIIQGGSGTAPAYSPVFLVHHSSGTFNMMQGFVVDRGGLGAGGAGVLLDGTGFGGSNPSWAIKFNAYDAGNTLHQAAIAADLSGNLQFNPGGGGNAYFFNNNATGIGIPGSTSGYSNLAAPATGGGTTVLPKGSGTLLQTGSGAGNLLQTQRAAGCQTGTTQFSTCDTTVNWPHAFADLNYTVTCSGEGLTGTGAPAIAGIDLSAVKTASAVTVRTMKMDAVATLAQFTTIDCIAIHD